MIAMRRSPERECKQEVARKKAEAEFIKVNFVEVSGKNLESSQT
jgi:hypothetical protein